VRRFDGIFDDHVPAIKHDTNVFCSKPHDGRSNEDPRMPEMTTQSPRASLVESIPVGLESLRDTPRIQYTADVLVRLTLAAQSTIDLTAMYWALLPDPKVP